MASCCCSLLYPWWLGLLLVYRCLVGMVDTKPQRRRLTKQQHHEGSGVLHHEGSGVLHHEGSGVLHHEGSGVLHDTAKYYTKGVADFTTTIRAALSYYTEAPKFYTTKAPEYLLHQKKTTLSDLTTKRFLNARAEISIWVYIYLSVVFMVISHWELIVDLKWENKNFHTGNSFVILLWLTSSPSTFWQVYIGIGHFSRPVSCAVICLVSYFGGDYCLSHSAYGHVQVVRRLYFKDK